MVKAKTTGVRKQKIEVGKLDEPTAVGQSVTQVVEVVEDVKDAPVEESVYKEEIVEVVEKPEEKEVLQQKDTPEVNEEEMVSESAHEKNREVVEEIFAKGNSRIGEEMEMDVKENVASIYWWAIAVISCVVTIGGILIFVNSKDKFNFTLPTFLASAPTPTSQPTATPTPLPPDRSQVKVQVLNGAGVAGAAGKMKSWLEEKGYVVMGTGNADNYDYEETVIQVKEEAKNVVDLLKTDLGEIYKVASEVATLDLDAESDVVVIVGKK